MEDAEKAATREQTRRQARSTLLALMESGKAKMAASPSEDIVDVLTTNEIKGLILSLVPTLPVKTSFKGEFAAYYESLNAPMSPQQLAIEDV